MSENTCHVTVTCADCDWTRTATDLRTAANRLHDHHDSAHRHLDTPIIQLVGVDFRSSFLAAVAAFPPGHRFTTADLHGKVPDPPDHHWWGTVQKEAARLGLCVRVGPQTSDLATTRDSLVWRWERTATAVDVRGAA